MVSCDIFKILSVMSDIKFIFDYICSILSLVVQKLGILYCT